MTTNHRQGLVAPATAPQQTQDSSRTIDRCDDEYIAALRDRIVDLEVELIAAEVGLRSQPAMDFNNVDPAYLITAADALQNTASSPIQTRDNHQPDPLIAALAALDLWLQPHQPSEIGNSLNRIRLALACGALAVLAAASFIHIAYALLLIPIGGAMSYLLWRNQDRQWLRIGAKRRFEQTQVQPPAAWTEDAVRSHQQLLNRHRQRQTLLTTAATAIPDTGSDDHSQPHAAVAEAFAALNLCTDTIDTATTIALQHHAQRYRISQALQAARDELRASIARRDALS